MIWSQGFEVKKKDSLFFCEKKIYFLAVFSFLYQPNRFRWWVFRPFHFIFWEMTMQLETSKYWPFNNIIWGILIRIGIGQNNCFGLCGICAISSDKLLLWCTIVTSQYFFFLWVVRDAHSSLKLIVNNEQIALWLSYQCDQALYVFSTFAILG